MKNILTLVGGLALSLTNVVAADSIGAVQDQTTVKVSVADRPAFDYRFAGYPFKPYASQLYSPSGVAVLRDAPADHPWHHGLMLAIEVEGVIFWEEGPARGRQLQREIAVRDGVTTQQLDWQSSSNSVLLCETRTIQPHAKTDVTLLTWRSRFETPPGKDAVVLTKGHHYYGLGMRFVQSMDKVATFQNSSGQLGEVVRGNQHLTPAAWVACTGPVGDKFVTVAIFDHPTNLRHPAPKFTMVEPFAYISTTLNLWKEPFTLKAGQPLELCYGVAVWDGKMTALQIERVYRQWLEVAPRSFQG